MGGGNVTYPGARVQVGVACGDEVEKAAHLIAMADSSVKEKRRMVGAVENSYPVRGEEDHDLRDVADSARAAQRCAHKSYRKLQDLKGADGDFLREDTISTAAQGGRCGAAFARII